MNRESAIQIPGEIHLADEAELVVGRMIVRPATLEILVDGKRETIEPRMMQLLVALARAGGQVVSRDSLVLSCWGGRAIGDDAINRCVAKVRRLAGEAAGFRIETITRVGYRLIADAPPGGASQVEGTGSTAGDEEGSGSARQRLSRRTLIGGGAVAGAALAGGWWLLKDGDITWIDDIPAAARAHFERGQLLFDADRREDAAAAFQLAADGAPDFADAWGWIALCMALARYSQPAQSADRTDAGSRAAAERALALDPRNAAALTAQAIAIPIYGDWLNAETALRRALQADPRLKTARDFLAAILEHVGRWRDSIELLRPYSAQFDTWTSTRCRLAIAMWSIGRLADADQAIDAMLRRWPLNTGVWFTRYWIYVRSGRAERALAMSAGGSRPARVSEGDFELSDLYARAVLTPAPANVEQAMIEHRRRAEAGAGYCENAIQLAAQLGRLDEAFAWCDAYYFARGFRVAEARFAGPNQAYTLTYSRRTAFLFTPILAPMRQDPRFANLIEEMGLTSYWRRSGTRSDVMA